MHFKTLIIQLLLFLVIFIPAISSAQQTDVPVPDTTGHILIDEEEDPDENDDEPFQFSEIETGEQILPVVIRKISDSLASALRNDKDFWYVNTVFDKKKEVEESPTYRNSIYDQNWFKTLMWVLLIAAFSGALIWFLISQKVSLFRKKNYLIHNDQQESADENIFEINYGNAIYQAVRNNDFRLAVRFRFLQILKTLSEHHLITYQQELTNFHYQSQLYNTPHYSDFVKLARHFEFVWYGDYPLSEKHYQLISKDFDRFLNQPGLQH